MGLSTSLNTAVAGLHATQVGIGVVSQNVANADKAGYVRRVVTTTDTVSGNTLGVQPSHVQRLLDTIVQSQLWQESAGAAYTSTRAEKLSALDRLYGAPGSASALDTMFSAFTGALQALTNDPSSYANRTAVVDKATLLAQRLNQLSAGVQTLRSEAETGISNAVTRVNEILDALTTVNSRITGAPNDQGTAALKDQRDMMVAELSQYMDIRTTEDGRGSLSIVTGSGTQIFDGRPAISLAFDGRGSLNPESLWSTDPAQRGVGTITIRSSAGSAVDAIANGMFRSGEIAALIEMRDKTLVQAQAQLDEIAAQMASALSDQEVAGTDVSAAPMTGFEVDLDGMAPGNTLTLDYRVTPGGAVQRFTFVRVDSAASLPLPASASGDPNNRVIGIDFSGGTAAVASRIQDALDAAGAGFAVSNPSGSVLQITDDGAGGTRDVLGLTARVTNTQPASEGGPAELPLFVDAAGKIFTGSYDGGSQTRGFAARINVNTAIVSDRSRLVVFDTSPVTPQGDSTRPQLMLDRLTQSQRDVTRATGLDGSNATSSLTVSAFVQRVVSSTGQAVDAAKRLDEGQQIALASVQSRFQATAQVNVDQEMSMLIELQTAYAANARIISTVKELMDVLLRI